MDFSFSEDQNAIRDLANQIFSDRSTDEFLVSFDRSDALYDDQLWSTLAEQGLLAITVPEDFGGTGMGFTELCFLLEEQARRVAPIPLFSSLVLGVLPISEFGSDAQKQKYLAPLATGELKLSAAIAELGMCEAMAGRVTATANGDSFTLNGSLDMVPDGASANAILVPAFDADGKQTVFIVDTDASGVEVSAVETSRGPAEGTLSLSNVAVSADAVLGGAGNGEAVLEWLEIRAEIALCAMQLGVTEEALKRTAEYTCERKQFGAPIGSFQAVAMQAADAYIAVEAIRSSYWLALYRLECGDDARCEMRSAKWFAADAGHRIVQSTQHLHGGMGSDVEYPIHRYFLWAKHIGNMIGNRGVQMAKLGALLASDDSIGAAYMQV